MPENIPQTGNGNGNGNSPVFSLGQKDTPSPQKTAVSFLKGLMQKEEPKSASSAAPTGIAGASGNVFTDLFGKKDIETQQAKPAAVSNAKSPASGVAIKPSVLPPGILGPKALLLKRQTDEFREQRQVKIFKRACVTLWVLGAVAFGVLTAQTNPDLAFFGTSTFATRFQASNAKIEAAQTQTNELRLRTAALVINQLNFRADGLLQDMATTGSLRASTSEKLSAQARLGEQREAIKTSLKTVKDMLRAPLAPALGGDVAAGDPLEREKQYEALLQQKLAADKSADSVRSLAQNRSLRGFLKNLDPDNMNDQKIAETMVKIRDQWNDDISIIAQLRQKRVQWTEVLDRLDSVTRTVDKLFGKGLYDQIGGIQYSNYEFNADSGVLSVTGSVKTEDTKTFSMMVNLVNALEQSPYFKDVGMRDFTKAKASESGFSGSIQLSFKLQKPDEKDSRDEAVPLTVSLP